MALAQLWTRRLWAAAGMVALAPAVLLAVLALALSGGWGGLGALSQALNGPAVPAAAGRVAAGAPVGRSVLRALAAAAVAPPNSGRAAATFTSVRAATLNATSHPAPGSVKGATDSVSGSGPGSSHVSGSHSPAGGQPPPRAHPTVLDGLVGAAAGVTSQVPGPAGSLATRTVLQAGAAANEILPPPGKP